MLNDFNILNTKYMLFHLNKCPVSLLSPLPVKICFVLFPFLVCVYSLQEALSGPPRQFSLSVHVCVLPKHHVPFLHRNHHSCNFIFK